ncbi:MAG: replication-associated recombination protein A [Bacilli bacterium]|nr:replication-associated recombination protein A [Bacilli bacterium]
MNLKPLAYRVRPKNLDEVIGQPHLVGPEGLLKKSVHSRTMLSIIFYGNPGCGKTTIAEAYAEDMGVKYVKLNAVTSNKNDLENAIEECKMYPQAFIIFDEVHRLNKDKQDILLPYIEDGTIYLLGMTTQNPYFAINKAIRSRCHLCEVKPLENADIVNGLKRALKHKDGLKTDKKFTDESLQTIAKLTSGDMRYALNYLEVINISSSSKTVTKEDVNKILRVPNWQMDENDNEHYDSVSALQKSIRGSDVDAALYYLARLCIVGDLESITRRLTVTAYEDIGLGNPQAVDRVYNACKAAEMVGLPEAVIPLGFAVVDLALSPKSKKACLAIHKAMDYAEHHPMTVMDYLKLTPVNVDEEDKYPYDRPDLWNKIQYLPTMIKDMKFYEPNSNPSAYEKILNENYEKLKKIKRTSDLRKLKAQKNSN